MRSTSRSRAGSVRREPPVIRRGGRAWVLRLRDEPEFRFDPAEHDPPARRALLARDGIDRALLCISGPLGIESIDRPEAEPLLEVHNATARELGRGFGTWGAVSLRPPDPDDVDALLDAGAVGVSLPAGALNGPEGLDRCGTLLERLERRDAPLLVHPGPGPWRAQPYVENDAPGWWPAMTRYVADMNAAWHAFAAFGRSIHPSLRVVFAMLAGGAPLHAERLAARGAPTAAVADSRLFYDTSSMACARSTRSCAASASTSSSTAPTGPSSMRRRRRCSGRPRARRWSARTSRASSRSAPRRWPRDIASLLGRRRRRAGRQALAMMNVRHARDLTRSELRALVAELARRPQAWRHLVHHDPAVRTYEQLLRDEHVAVWLICWMDDHDTGFHDHDVSCGALAVAQGAVVEERLALGGPPARRRMRAGDAIDFAASDIHRVAHGGGGPAITLNAYSPPLWRMGAYETTPTGELQRHSISYAEDLRPLELATGS